jgi:hypothetical protein
MGDFGETAGDNRAGGTGTAYDKIIGRLQIAKKAFLVRPDSCCEIGRIHHFSSLLFPVLSAIRSALLCYAMMFYWFFELRS